MNFTVILFILLIMFLFCNKCGSLGYINEKGKVDCQKCKISSDCEDIVTETGIINPEKIRAKTEVNDLTRLTVSHNINTLNMTFIADLKCVFCKDEKITSELRQMDQSDEPEERFLICHSCGKVWRD